MKTTIDLNTSRANLAVYADVNDFVHDMTIVTATADMRRNTYAYLDAIADLAAKGKDEDRDLAADTWSEIFEAFSDAIAGTGGAPTGKLLKEAQKAFETAVSAVVDKAKELGISFDGSIAVGSKTDKAIKPLLSARDLAKDAVVKAQSDFNQYHQFRNARTAAAEALKNRMAKHNLLINLKRGNFDITPMTVDQVMAAKGVTGTKARKAARQVHADKGAGKITGTASAQAPTAPAKSLSNLDKAAALIQLLSLEDLKAHAIAVNAAIAMQERETKGEAQARAKTTHKRRAAKVVDKRPSAAVH